MPTQDDRNDAPPPARRPRVPRPGAPAAAGGLAAGPQPHGTSETGSPGRSAGKSGTAGGSTGSERAR